MANWSNPTLTSTYTNFLAEVKGRDVDLALQFDSGTFSNLPTGAIRWDSSADRWKKWTGSAWGELTSTYALTGLSTTGNASIGGTLTVTGATTLATATATTPSTGDNSTKVATTAYVVAQGYAPLASPTFTGTPSGPTAAVNTNTTQLATTAFVVGQGYAKTADLVSSFLPLTGGTLTGNLTAPAFVPNSGTAPSDGMFLPATNSVGFATGGVERFRCNNGNFTAVSPNGSTRYPAFFCRAWICFNPSTNSILASGNVSSITDQGVGTTDVNLTTALPDVNAATATSTGGGMTTSTQKFPVHIANIVSTSKVTVDCRQVDNDSNTMVTLDPVPLTLAVFR